MHGHDTVHWCRRLSPARNRLHAVTERLTVGPMRRPRWLRSLTPWLLAGVCGCSSVLGLDDVLPLDDATPSADGGAASSGVASSSGASSGENSSSGATSSGAASSSGAIPPLAWAPVSVAVASHHACALQANGDVRCWAFAQSGPSVQEPIRYQGTPLRARALIAREGGFCAAPHDTNAPVVCWPEATSEVVAIGLRAGDRPLGARILSDPLASNDGLEVCAVTRFDFTSGVECTKRNNSVVNYTFSGTDIDQVVVGSNLFCIRNADNGVTCQATSTTSPQTATITQPLVDLSMSATELCGVSQVGESFVKCYARSTLTLTQPPVTHDIPLAGPTAQVALTDRLLCVRGNGEDNPVRCVLLTDRPAMIQAPPIQLGGDHAEHLAAGPQYACVATRAKRVFCWDETSMHNSTSLEEIRPDNP